MFRKYRFRKHELCRFLAAERWKATRRMYCFTQHLVKNIQLITKLLEAQKGTKQTHGRKKTNKTLLSIVQKVPQLHTDGNYPLCICLVSSPVLLINAKENLPGYTSILLTSYCHSGINIHLLTFKTMCFKFSLISNP